MAKLVQNNGKNENLHKMAKITLRGGAECTKSRSLADDDVQASQLSARGLFATMVALARHVLCGPAPAFLCEKKSSAKETFSRTNRQLNKRSYRTRFSHVTKTLLSISLCIAMVLCTMPRRWGRYEAQAADSIPTVTLTVDFTKQPVTISGIERLDALAGSAATVKLSAVALPADCYVLQLFVGGQCVFERSAGGDASWLAQPVPAGISRLEIRCNIGRWVGGWYEITVPPRSAAIFTCYSFASLNFAAGGPVGADLWIGLCNVLGTQSSRPDGYTVCLNGRCGTMIDDGGLRYAIWPRSDLPLDYGIVEVYDPSGKPFGSAELSKFKWTNWPTGGERGLWGDSEDHGGITHYVDAATGETSVAVTDQPMQYIYDVAGISGAQGSWFALDNSGGTFAVGSRFHIRWLTEGDDGFEEEWNKLDESVRTSVDKSKIRLLKIGVNKPDGSPYESWDPPVEFWVPLGEGWTEADVKARFLGAGPDESVELDFREMTFPGSTEAVRCAVLKLSHFSPYIVYDEITAEDRAQNEPQNPPEEPKNDNAKTGDAVTNITIAGLGMVLVLALGVMLRLTTKKKSEK